MALLPLIIFGGIIAIAGHTLYERDFLKKDITTIPAMLIGQKAPSLALQPLANSSLPALTNAIMKEKLTLVNFFASWCLSCRDEHPLLQKLADDDRLHIVAINYKDQQENALRFLSELGNPFKAIGVDLSGATAIDWGVYGIPETYLVATDGTILYRQVGPFDALSIKENLYPIIEKALNKPVLREKSALFE